MDTARRSEKDSRILLRTKLRNVALAAEALPHTH